MPNDRYRNAEFSAQAPRRAAEQFQRELKEAYDRGVAVGVTIATQRFVAALRAMLAEEGADALVKITDLLMIVENPELSKQLFGSLEPEPQPDQTETPLVQLQ